LNPIAVRLEASVENVVFHIGVHKTASTTIQAFLRLNAEVLSGAGIYLPRSGCLDPEGYANSHNIAWELLGIDLFRPELGSFAMLLDELSGAPQETAVLSAEDLEFLSDEQVQALATATRDYRRSVIVYLRRHDDLMASEYTHQLREGVTTASFEDWFAQSQFDPRFDFLGLLARWKAAGFEMRVRSFDTSIRGGRDICLDFVHTLGVDSSVVPSMKSPDPQNIRLPGKVAVLLRESMARIKARFDLGPDTRALTSLVWWHLQQFVPGEEEFNPLSVEMRRRLLEQYAPMYAQLEAEYVAGAPLFSRMMSPRPEIANLNRLTTDEIIDGLSGVIGALWLHLNKGKNPPGAK
jgi:hypothetical protein